MPGELAARLEAEAAAVIEAQRRAGAKPRREMSITETREAMRGGGAWELAPVPEVAVRDTVAGGVPVRLYGPATERAVLFLHGGRFFSGGLNSHDSALRVLAIASGLRVCAVDYRLAPEHRHPAAVEDAVAAGRWLQGDAAEVVTAGDSAGGYLAAMAALALPACGQVLIYPMLDPACDTASYREYWRGPWPAGEDMQRGWELYGGPALTAGAGAFPPTVLITAGIDPLRDEGLAFAAGLRAAGTRVEAHHFAGMPHGFSTQTRLARSRELIGLVGGAVRGLRRAGA